MYGKVFEKETHAFHRMVNYGYTYSVWFLGWTRRICWVGSSMAIMFFVPFMLEQLSE